MDMKTNIEVIIHNKRYTMKGYESEAYLQKIASYLNEKDKEMRAQEGYNHLDNDLREVLMQINLADDYFKTLSEKEELERQLEQKNREIFELKHDLVESTKKEAAKNQGGGNSDYNGKRRK